MHSIIHRPGYNRGAQEELVSLQTQTLDIPEVGSGAKEEYASQQTQTWI
jgi:hypothetical protein